MVEKSNAWIKSLSNHRVKSLHFSPPIFSAHFSFGYLFFYFFCNYGWHLLFPDVYYAHAHRSNKARRLVG